VIGRHSGLHNFTVGQRKGLGFAARRPMYVVALDTHKNRVIVGEDGDLHSRACEVRNVNWVPFEAPGRLVRARVRIRNRHEPADATITALSGATARVVFDEPQRAITPGQAAVFYSGELVLGGGWITNAK